ncbi:hypothetical protein K402DRAFT_273198 [Aulographum hederae CBS 113979]|uniref:Uncharacterized protein n=1 Tax=Aulographum hederae CBS 113979 TaxID=1176131 RepID=A0A6G1H8I4_9PEZI|nr:hypothetical protein K402DRAFT_273198 [Aulographum hederae CBS 113979]
MLGKRPRGSIGRVKASFSPRSVPNPFLNLYRKGTLTLNETVCSPDSHPLSEECIYNETSQTCSRLYSDLLHMAGWEKWSPVPIEVNLIAKYGEFKDIAGKSNNTTQRIQVKTRLRKDQERVQDGSGSFGILLAATSGPYIPPPFNVIWTRSGLFSSYADVLLEHCL